MLFLIDEHAPKYLFTEDWDSEGAASNGPVVVGAQQGVPQP